MKSMTVREALNDRHRRGDAPRRRPFLMGEEVAEYEGAYKITQGLLDEFGARRVIDTPITEHGFAGIGVGAAFGGLQADRRVHDLQLRHAGDRPDHQLGRQDALHVGGQMGCPIVFRGPNGAAARVAPSTARTTPPGTRRCPGSRSCSPTRPPMPRGC